MRPAAGNAFLRPDQNLSRSASLCDTWMALAPAASSTAVMRAISSSTSSGVPSDSHSRMAAASVS
ncbi:hypothetical protein D9M68_997460 [compost metagenome]